MSGTRARFGWLVYVCLFLGVVAVAVFSKPFFVFSADAEKQALFASNKNLYELQAGEFAVIETQNAPATGRKVVHTIVLSDGSEYSGTYDEHTSLAVLEYKAGTKAYVQLNAQTTIHSVNEFSGFDSTGKIEKSLRKKTEKGKTTSVIVHLNSGASDIYNANIAEAERSAKFSQHGNAKKQVEARIGKKVSQDLPIIDALAVTVSATDLDKLAEDPNVRSVELDREMHATLDTSVAEIGATAVWGFTDPVGNSLTGKGVRIAVIDTGVDYTHPDLGGCLGTTCKVIGGYDFVNNDTNPMDDHGHGTHVAATAAGKGLLKGVAPDAKILAYKVLNAGGSGQMSQVIAGINRAVDPNNDGNPADHVDIISMSLGAQCGATYSIGCGPDDSTSVAIDNATAAGVVSVIAAGNAGPSASTVGSPGVARTAITVAAACKASQVGDPNNYNCAQTIADFSSRGPVLWNSQDLQKPDISAPGVLICAARWGSSFSGAPSCFDNAHVRISGTSMATPHVAGAVALLRQSNPTMTPSEIKAWLKNTARPLSGASYSDQGAGEIDVTKAIPFVSKVQVSPALWQLASSPVSKYSTSTKQFVLSPQTPLGSTSVSFEGPIGVSAAFDKQQVNLASNTTLTANVVVDNDVAVPGFYNAQIKLSSGTSTVVVIPVLLTVSPTVGVTPAETLDFGLNNPALNTWNSEVLHLTLTNLRTDVSQSVTLSAQQDSGVTFNGPAGPVALTAGGSAAVDVSLTASNASLANKVHGGKLVITNDLGLTQNIPTTFSKFYTLILQDPNTSDFTTARLGVYNRNTQTFAFITPASSQVVLYTTTPSAYDMYIVYPQSVLVFKSNVQVNGVVTLPLSRALANHQVTIAMNGVDGTPLSNMRAELAFKIPTIQYSSSAPTTGIWVSDVPNEFQVMYGVSSSEVTSASPLYLSSVSLSGLTTNKVLSVTPTMWKKQVMQLDMNAPAGTQVLPALFTCNGLGNCQAYWYVGESHALPYAQTVYASQEIGNFYQVSNQNEASQCPSNPSDTYFVSPSIVSGNSTRIVTSYDAGAFFNSLLIPGAFGSTTYVGMGPSVWFASFKNDSSRVYLLPGFGIVASPLLRQDYAIGEHAAIPYTLYKNGAVLQTGSFAMFNMRCNNFFSATLLEISTSASTYRLTSTYPYKNAGDSMNGSVDISFNTALADPNPPAVRRLNFFANGLRSEIYNTSGNNELEFEIDPVGGTLASVGVQYSTDGTAFTSLTLATSSTGYSTTMPSVPASVTKVKIKLTASDAAGNTFVETFELPSRTLTVPVGDTKAPLVSITAPANGATVSGVVSVAASSSDAVGVTKVEFYNDGILASTDTSSPYTWSWNTASSTNGSHTLQAKAFDAAGNVGSSTVSTVTVSNTSSSDTTPPTVTITSPANGTKVKGNGNVTINTGASDASGIASISIKTDNTTVQICSNVTSCTYTWNGKSISSGSHTITATAVDKEGNTSSTSITISK